MRFIAAQGEVYELPEDLLSAYELQPVASGETPGALLPEAEGDDFAPRFRLPSRLLAAEELEEVEQGLRALGSLLAGPPK